MSDGKKYRVAVIGRTGKGDYGHGLDTVWVNHPRAEPVAVADEDEAGRAAAAKRLGVKATYADYRKMLAAEKPQVVSVAPRWLDAHRDMVVACAEHGSSVFLEKPVARTMQEADEMVAACDKAHVKCAVAHQTRYAPRVKVVKELIASGRIGDVVELHGHGKCDRRGGGEDQMVLGTPAMSANCRKELGRASATTSLRPTGSTVPRSGTSPPSRRRPARVPATGSKCAARKASSTSALGPSRRRTCARTRPGCRARARPRGGRSPRPVSMNRNR
jgi:hypothetical protein